MRKQSCILFMILAAVILILFGAIISAAPSGISARADDNTVTLEVKDEEGFDVVFGINEVDYGGDYCYISGLKPNLIDGYVKAGKIININMTIPATFSNGSEDIPLREIRVNAFKDLTKKLCFIISLDFSGAENLRRINAYAFASSGLFTDSPMGDRVLNLSGCKQLEFIGTKAFSNNPITGVNFGGIEHLNTIYLEAFFYTYIHSVDLRGMSALSDSDAIIDEDAFGNAAAQDIFVYVDSFIPESGTAVKGYLSRGRQAYIICDSENTYEEYQNNTAFWEVYGDIVTYELQLTAEESYWDFDIGDFAVTPALIENEPKLYNKPIDLIKQPDGTWGRDPEFKVPVTTCAGDLKRLNRYWQWGNGLNGITFARLNKDTLIVDGTLTYYIINDNPITRIDVKLTDDYKNTEPLIFPDCTPEKLKEYYGVSGYYESGDEYGILDFEFIFDSGGLTVGENTVTAVFDDLSCTFSVTVALPAVTHIEIKAPPDKTTYSAFEHFDTSGLSISGLYNNDLELAIDSFSVRYNNGDCLRYGDTFVTLVYAAGGGELTKEISVTVTKAAVDLAALNVSFDDKTVYYNGDPQYISIAGALPENVTVRYDVNGKSEVGEYLITAHFTITEYANEYEPIPSMTATLTIIKKPLSPWALIGIALSCAALTAAAFMAVYTLRRKRRGLAEKSGAEINSPPLSGGELDAVRQIITNRQSPLSALPPDLTLRERDVAALLLAGKKTKEIAAKLFISSGTVKNHISSILRKTGCNDQLAFVVKYGGSLPDAKIPEYLPHKKPNSADIPPK